MKIFSLSKKLNKNFLFNYTRRNFALSMSFKNKINSFFIFIHPDVLGNSASEEIRKNNENSIKEFNSYLENLDNSQKFEKKTLYFYIKIEKKSSFNSEKQNDYFEKISVDLKEVNQNISDANKYAIQSKYK